MHAKIPTSRANTARVVAHPELWGAPAFDDKWLVFDRGPFGYVSGQALRFAQDDNADFRRFRLPIRTCKNPHISRQHRASCGAPGVVGRLRRQAVASLRRDAIRR